MKGAGAGRTPWLDGALAPAREGVYARRAPAGPYSCWSAERWYGDAPTPALAAAARKPSRHPHAAWRGLADPPDAPCYACKGATVVDRGWDEDAQRDLIEECPAC